MPSPSDLNQGIVRKELHIFYVLDTSGSMQGAPIAALNDAMRSTVKALNDKFQGNADATLKIAIMTYSNGAEWVTFGENHLESVEFFVWEDVKAVGMTYLGAALDLLREGLSRNTMMKSKTGNKTPVIIFMTDGCPTDNWRDALKKIQDNKWYQSAIKIGIALGQDADTGVLAEVIGGSEGVIQAQELDKFADMIRLVSVVSALRGSVSQVTAPTASDIVKEVQENEEDEKAPVIPKPESSGGDNPIPEPLDSDWPSGEDWE